MESNTCSSVDDVKAVWRNTDCVCFDVDSTVCTDEAIDELASFLGAGEEVAKLTSEAMGGGMTYKESLKRRLDIMQPSRQDVTRFITEHNPQLTPGVKKLMNTLQSHKIPIYLISGGFQTIIETVAEELNIPKENIIANRMLFYYDGQYAGFDEKQPTCESGGKPKAIAQLKEKYGYKALVHIGDGTTDMEACPPADAFIGFGGNQVRQKVKDGAQWFVMSFDDLTSELSLKKQRCS